MNVPGAARAPFIVALAALSVMESGCSKPAAPGNNIGGSTDLEGAEASATTVESRWSVSQENDPMSNVGITTATTTAEGQRFNFETTVTCTENGAIRYTFAAFDKAGQGAPLRPQLYGGSRFYRVQYRPDDGRVVNYSHYGPAYLNQAQIRYGDARTAGLAQVLSLRFDLMSGIETIQLDQTDQAFRSALQPCLDAYDARDAQRASSSHAGPLGSEAGAPATVVADEIDPNIQPVTADEIAEQEQANSGQ